MWPRAAAADPPVRDVQLRDRYSPAFGAIVSRTYVFQLNVSDSFATTIGQSARGGPVRPNWHLDFNISRKFY